MITYNVISIHKLVDAILRQSCLSGSLNISDRITGKTAQVSRCENSRLDAVYKSAQHFAVAKASRQ